MFGIPRGFLVGVALLLAALPVFALPANNPTAQYQLAWTDALQWKNVINIQDVQGGSLDARLAAAQEKLAAQGGGVVFFPAGVYVFKGDIALKDGIILRGADPAGVTDARREGYNPPTKFAFPQYAPTFTGDGTPVDTAFKGIVLEDPATAANCGVVNIAINHGHIDLVEGENHRVGRNRLVYGCVLRNAAVAATDVPDRSIGQHAWQRYTMRHHGAIRVYSEENALVANNRLPKSGEDDFLMKDCVILDGKNKPMTVQEGIWFDYDNRPGIQVNHTGIGGGGNSLPDGTPLTYPWGFRKGIVIRDNYIYCTGRCAIAFTGDGAICSFNVMRFKPEVVRWTTDGKHLTNGGSTNDNRAVEMRGWRWTLEGNDYEVYKNRVPNSNVYINDGEGLMHEDHVNSIIVDSKLINNKGNSYLSLYKTGGIDGLLVQGNDIRTKGGIDAIYVVADRNYGKFFCRNVRIIGNTTAGSGIRISGTPGENNLVQGNRHIGPGGKINNEANAVVEGNTGYGN